MAEKRIDWISGAAMTGAAIARSVFAPDPVPSDFATKGGGALSARPQAYRAGSFELMNSRHEVAWMTSHYSGLRLPTGILFGRDDAVLDPALHGEATAAVLPNARLELVEGGHMLPVTRPQGTAEFIREIAGVA